MRVRERGCGGRSWERGRAGLATAPPSHCVEAFTAPELTPAIALYERFGFRPSAPYRESQCLAALYFEREV